MKKVFVCKSVLKRYTYCLFISIYFCVQICLFNPSAAAVDSMPYLATSGAQVALTEPFSPPIILGINLWMDNPLKFDFLIDRGDADPNDPDFNEELNTLVKYFLAALTIPEEQMWVNLSPYEKNRIIPEVFGKTEMGHDLLVLDYMLKQLSSSLMHPDSELGKTFWEQVYLQAKEQFHSTDIPMNTFNKIWIVPEKAMIYEHSQGAVIVESHLKVMLEEDYISLEANKNSTKHGLGAMKKNDIAIVSGVSGQIVREILIPAIEKEVNEGKTFARLRQIYHSMLLASWYKKTFKNGPLNDIYINRQKTRGVEIDDPRSNEAMYNQYVKSFQKGVVNVIKEDYDPFTQKIISRKYFSGGVTLENSDFALIAEETRFDNSGIVDAIRRVVQRLNRGIRLTLGVDALDPSGAQLSFRNLLYRSLNQQFDAYLENDPYLKKFKDTELRKAFPPAVMKALIRDRSLRAVFHIKFEQTDGDVGPLEALDQEVLDTIGGENLLNEHTSFLVGNAERALMVIRRGQQILVGVTDRYWEDTLMRGSPVANRRQDFFPLADGTWLGLKGAGDFLDEKANKTYISKYERGLAVIEEAKQARQAREVLKNGDFFPVQFLGYRLLNVLTDGEGELVPISRTELDSSVVPVLIFNRVYSPHRTDKLPQLLKNDPGLKNLWEDISRALKNNRRKAPKTVKAMIESMVRQIAVNSAYRHNHDIYKETIHLQDFTFAGEESDNEEVVGFEFMRDKIEKDLNNVYAPYVLKFFEKYKINLADLSGIFFLITELTERFAADEATKYIVAQDPLRLLQIFFSTYLSRLDDDHLQGWVKEFDVMDLDNRTVSISRPLQWIFVTKRLSAFHPYPSQNAERDSFEVMLTMQKWLNEEIQRRNMIVSMDAKTSAEPSRLLLSPDYLGPGTRSPREGDRSYGNPLYPVFNSKAVQSALKKMQDVVSPSDSVNVILSLEGSEKEIMAYSAGEKTLAESIEVLKSTFSLSSGSLTQFQELQISTLLRVLRVSAKYVLSTPMIHLVYMRANGHDLLEHYREGKEINEETRRIYSMLNNEIAALAHDDRVVASEIVKEWNTLDLGDLQTLQEVDAAMTISEAVFTKGGIDLNPAIVDMDINKQAGGLQFPQWQQVFKEVSVEGFVPFIIQMETINNANVLMGLPE